MKLITKLEGLFRKIDTTEASYMKALEAKEEQLLELQAELKEKESILKDMHKEALLGNISEGAYTAEKDKVEALKAKVAEAQKELELIQEYKNEDVLSILAELEANAGEYGKETQVKIREIEKELLEAKLGYIEKIIEARHKYKTIISPKSKLDALKIKLGMQVRSYVSDAFEAMNLISVGNGGHERLVLEQKELYDALVYGRKPERLERFVKAGK